MCAALTTSSSRKIVESLCTGPSAWLLTCWVVSWNRRVFSTNSSVRYCFSFSQRTSGPGPRSVSCSLKMSLVLWVPGLGPLLLRVSPGACPPPPHLFWPLPWLWPPPGPHLPSHTNSVARHNLTHVPCGHEEGSRMVNPQWNCRVTGYQGGAAEKVFLCFYAVRAFGANFTQTWELG